jgi:hypothetical protein
MKIRIKKKTNYFLVFFNTKLIEILYTSKVFVIDINYFIEVVLELSSTVSLGV